jgi:hypothetical protein
MEFTGKNFIHQLTLIFDVIGSPNALEIAHIENQEAIKFLESQKTKKKVVDIHLSLRAYITDLNMIFNAGYFPKVFHWSSCSCYCFARKHASIRSRQSPRRKRGKFTL